MNKKYFILIIIGFTIIFGLVYVLSMTNSENITHNTSITCYEPTSEMPHEDAVWNLDECYWFVGDPYMPFELLQVLTYCDILPPFEDKILYDFSNSTHYIDSNTCEWKIIDVNGKY